MRPVLVVDDSLTVRMDLDEAFVGAGFEAVLAADLASARRALAERTFALVVLDVLLPDGDGLELLAELKRAPQHAATPVVLLSTEAEVQHRVRGLQTGADEYVGKPYDAAHVVARARELVRRGGGVRRDAARAPVLLVDDSVTAREALREALVAAGLDVLTAATGEEGLRIAADRRPSAIVVDGVLPGIDGPTVVRQIRGDAVLRTTPCILLTGSGTVGELRALEAGADAYVLKAAGHAVVLARLQALLRASSPPSVVGAAGLLSPKRILAVARGETLLRADAERIREDGHDLVFAESVEDAGALLAVENVDGVLVDAGASPSAALAAVRALRAEQAWAEIPLLVAGAPDDHALALEAINAGADDYVPASSGAGILRARVRAQLRRRQFEDENRSRDAYARSAAILETIADAFFAVDRAWRLVYVNRAFEELLGVGRDELLGGSLWDLGRALAGGAFRDELRRAADQRVPATFEVPAPGARWLEVRAFPHGDGLTAHLRDVTERRRSQEFQAHLIGIVGHDLRTPLTAISASAAMLVRDPSFAERHRRAVQRIAGGAARMTRLINDLLDYSRTRLGKGLPIARRAADLDAICRDALEDVRAAYPERRIRYVRDGDGAGEWDPDRVEQVVTNLLTNALRYSPPDSEVRLSWCCEREEKVLLVQNEGPPIDPHLRQHIFEPFERGDAAGNAWGGVGLGLYIVKQIVRTHGGTVAVRSDAEHGTEFEVRLPARAAERDAAVTDGARG